MTLGEDRVRLKFNPSEDSLVSQIKQKTAELVDLCQRHVIESGEKYSDAAEQRRLWELAQTHYENAAMWAVKAATFGK